MKRSLSKGWLIALLLGWVVPVALPLTAQESPFPAPAASPTGVVGANYRPLDAIRRGIVAMPAKLARKVSVTKQNVLLQQALLEIATQAGLGLSYGEDLARSATTISLDVTGVRAADALAVAVQGTRWAVYVNPAGQVTVVKAAARQAGAITGRVTDAKTGDAIAGAELTVEGTRVRTSTGERGFYRLTDVEAGSYTLVVRRVGYAKQSRSVAVTADQELTVDFALAPVVTQLNEIVTTVTGEQRLRELGHVVGRIAADSLVKAAPISSLSELLTGRVPGVVVSQGQGTVGGSVKIQVRGPNSVLLGNEPIVVIDGVRYSSDVIPNVFRIGAAATESTSPLNDLNPNDIESIEIVKGPSAATLYGTDASNGVIVIATKRGRAGPTRWNTYAKGSRVDVPDQRYPDLYWAWGTVFGTPNSIRTPCILRGLAEGWCQSQDSITVVANPLNDPDLSTFSSQPRWETGLNVSGGRQDVRYYFAANMDDAIGPVAMPRAILRRLEEQRGTELPNEYRYPNTLNNVNLRANVSADLGGRGQLNVSSAYIRNAARTLSSRNPYSGAATATPGSPYGLGQYQPEEAFAGQSTEKTDRFLGTAAAQWSPTRWLLTRGTVGLDMGSRNRASLVRRAEAPNIYSGGIVNDDRASEVATTADLSATATVSRGRWSSRTSIGAQYVRTLTDALTSVGFDLPPGGTSIGEAGFLINSRSYRETATLGSYAEETVGLNDRLFLTGALRADGASAFGQNYEAAVYPKLSVSWIMTDEPFMPRVPGVEELRFRYAYGVSGQQPNPQWSRPSYGTVQGFVNGSLTTATSLTGIGNPNLRPERVREHEIGVDVTGVGSRIQLGLTWYRRRTYDQIVSALLPVGYGSIYTNLGVTAQHGFEADLTVHLFETRTVAVDMMAQHSLQRTRLIDKGAAGDNHYLVGGYAEGYSIGARFQQGYTYNDVNGDGIITGSELTFGDDVYEGESAAPLSSALTTVVGLFDRRVRISALFERRSGFTQINGSKTARCTAGRCKEAVDPNTPLAAQATIAAIPYGVRFIESADFTRFRELAVALDLPTRIARAMRLRSATLSVSARNVALWTDFSGGDPESDASMSALDSSFLAGGIPQGRTWTVRVDVGL